MLELSAVELATVRVVSRLELPGVEAVARELELGGSGSIGIDVDGVPFDVKSVGGRLKDGAVCVAYT